MPHRRFFLANSEYPVTAVKFKVMVKTKTGLVGGSILMKFIHYLSSTAQFKNAMAEKSKILFTPGNSYLTSPRLTIDNFF